MELKYKAAIFDMDGTILDTIEDLRAALNHTLASFGHRSDFTAAETCRFFGSGARTAVVRALLAESGVPPETIIRVDATDLFAPASDKTVGASVLLGVDTAGISVLPLDSTEVAAILDAYNPWYAAHCAIQTGPFPGIPALLQDLTRAGMKTAVVSNKPDDAVQSLCRDYFPDLFDHAAGETAGIRKKPAPDMVWAALSSLGVSIEDAVYIGDSEVDIQTARNAGLDCICVDWGFREREELRAQGAPIIVSSTGALREHILAP